MRWATHPKDANHDYILGELKKAGVFVMDIHNAGHGLGDILARHVVTKLPVFIEIKALKRDKLTAAEKVMASVYAPTGAWKCVHTLDEALAAVGLARPRDVGTSEPNQRTVEAGSSALGPSASTASKPSTLRRGS